jgi:hypothetical protein
MASVSVGVESHRLAVGCRGEVSQSPRFSASLIGLRSLGFVGHCGHGERWFPCPGLPPFFIVALHERGPTAIHGRCPRSGHRSDRFPDPEITFLTRSSPCRAMRARRAGSVSAKHCSAAPADG